MYIYDNSNKYFKMFESECLKMSSSFEEDKLVIPVKGTIKIECSSKTVDFFLYLIYKNVNLNEWIMIKKHVKATRKLEMFKFKIIFLFIF